jgi:hypothetical protein
VKAQVLEAVSQQPDFVRALFEDAAVRKALESLGILATMFELHAPAATSRSHQGLGQTLCKRKGRRHPTLVTCKNCLARMKPAR